MTLYHDVSPVRGVNKSDIDAALSRALRHVGIEAAASPRFDSAGLVGAPGALDEWSRHVDQMMLEDAGFHPSRLNLDGLNRIRQDAAAQGRQDALTGGAGGFPRDFEFVRTRIREEKRQPLTAMRYFPTSTEVPLGPRRYSTRRSLGSGEAQIYAGGNEFPNAKNTYVEEWANIAYVVCSVETNFFEALTTNWAGLQQYSRDLRLAYRLVEERLNRIAWGGDVGAGINGVLNYPSLVRMTLDTLFNDSATSEDVSSELTDLVNLPMVASVGTFGATEVLVSPRVHAFLFSRKHSTQGGTDTTIGGYFLLGQEQGGAGIRAIRMAPELTGIGPNGEDGILAYRPDPDSIEHVLPQEPTALPVYQSSPIDQMTVIFAATGGISMPDVGNSVLGLVDVI